MKNRSFICFILAAVMLLSLCACGAQAGEPAAETQPADTSAEPVSAPDVSAPSASEEIEVESAELSDVDKQLELLSAAVEQLIQPVDELPWYYTVADLDHDGNLEFIAASQHPEDRSTNLKIWTVRDDRTSLSECSVVKDPEESFPDIMTDSADTYYDPATDTWFYMFYDNVILSDTEVYTSKSAFNLKNGAISYEAFAVEHTVVENKARTVSYTDSFGDTITAAQYNASGVTNFANAERSNTSFEWLKEAEVKDHARIVESYSVFMGVRKATETFPVPMPAAFLYPEGGEAPATTPAPATVPTPTPAPAPVSLYITKNPTNETRNIGKTATFVACANTFESLAWTFVAPNGTTCTPQQFAALVPNSVVSGTNSTTITVSNVIAGMHGWGAYCTFYYRGQTARTSTAYIYIKGIDPSPTPTPGPKTGDYVGTVIEFDNSMVTVECPGIDYFMISRSICEITGELYIGADARVYYTSTNARKPTVTRCEITGKEPDQHGDFAGTVFEFNYDTVTIECPGIDYFTVSKSICEISGELYTGAPARVYYDSRWARGVHVCRCTITGKEPEPQPVYGAMSGTSYHDTAFTVYVVLANGKGLHLNGGLVTIEGGNDIEGAPCVVYYSGEPTEETIYKIVIQGFEPAPAPEPEPEPEPEPAVGTMKGVSHHDTAATIAIRLENGTMVHIRGELVTIKGGSEIEDAECVVYYKGTPNEENIFKVEISGYDPVPEPASEPLPPIEEAPAEETASEEVSADQEVSEETGAEETASEPENG